MNPQDRKQLLLGIAANTKGMAVDGNGYVWSIFASRLRALAEEGKKPEVSFTPDQAAAIKKWWVENQRKEYLLAWITAHTHSPSKD